MGFSRVRLGIHGFRPEMRDRPARHESVPAPMLQSRSGMASFLARLRSFAPLLVAVLGFSLPVAHARVETPPTPGHAIAAAATVPADASSLISTFGVGRQPVPIHRIAAAGQLRSVDVDA